MTEVGKNWALNQSIIYAEEWDKAGGTVYGEAHFWLRAFVQEARRRAEIVGDTQYLSDALEELVREFGLDGEGEK